MTPLLRGFRDAKRRGFGLDESIVFSRHYHPDTQRLHYPAGFIMHMPFRWITTKEIYDIKSTLAFNGIEHYPDELRHEIAPYEVGHDDRYRYLMRRAR